MSNNTQPLLIVGAGPTGLVLANLLAQYGVAFRLIEQRQEHIKTSNALAIQSRSLEVWDSIGIAQTAIANGLKMSGLAINTADKRVKLTFPSSINTQFPFVLALEQAESEQLLIENLLQQGVNVERGVSLIDVRHAENQVVAELQHLDGRKEDVYCDWLVAADGSHSMVRKKLNLVFDGAAISEKFIMMDAEVSADFLDNYFEAYLSPQGALALVPLRHGTRIICSVTHDPEIKDFQHPTVADFEYVIKQRCPHPVTINKVLWTSHFVAHHRMLDSFIHGRVLFAGDSAHVHSPVGGQGMNTGMQDAYNLAWKLALVLQGKCSAALLSTYDEERWPLARAILASTTKMTDLVTLHKPWWVWLRNNILLNIIKNEVYSE